MPHLKAVLFILLNSLNHLLYKTVKLFFLNLVTKTRVRVKMVYRFSGWENFVYSTDNIKVCTMYIHWLTNKLYRIFSFKQIRYNVLIEYTNANKKKNQTSYFMCSSDQPMKNIIINAITNSLSCTHREIS